MDSLTHPAIAPTRTPAPYQGGKRRLAPTVIARQRAIPHRTYVEPCVGMGGVFLRRPWRSPAEVINDISGDVATLFRVLQEHYAYFVDMLRFRVTSRAEFDRLRAIPGDRLTDLQRAVRFLHLQRLAFGGRVRGQNFGVSRRSPATFNVTNLEPMLAEIHERLAGVVIERLPFGDCIRRYDAAETLFYIDLPYWGCEADYGDAFGREDFTAMAEQLRGIAGRFLLSINDTPGVREVFAGFGIEEVQVTYTIGAKTGGGKRVGELLISNG